MIPQTATMPSTIISVVSILIAATSAIATVLIWKSRARAVRQSMYLSYNQSNQKTSEELDYAVISPLTAYDPTVDERTRMIRESLLDRFNRFYYLSDEKEKHIYYRKNVMGESVQDFYNHVRDNSGDEQLARKSTNALHEIHTKEPYFSYGDPSFWDIYFEDYDWSWEPPVSENSE